MPVSYQPIASHSVSLVPVLLFSLCRVQRSSTEHRLSSTDVARASLHRPHSIPHKYGNYYYPLFQSESRPEVNHLVRLIIRTLTSGSRCSALRLAIKAFASPKASINTSTNLRDAHTCLQQFRHSSAPLQVDVLCPSPDTVCS
jgi:hypothetical protein